MFKLGLVINPLAGVGGPIGHKGSDDLDAAAVDYSINNRAAQRALRCLNAMTAHKSELCIYGYQGLMAELVAVAADISFVSLGCPQSVSTTSRDDTLHAVSALRAAAVDLIVFVGGDGTARDICDELDVSTPVLGIPAGVKMHSAVYAVSPEAAAEIILALLRGDLVDIAEREVRDIDEEAFRRGQVKSRYFGELLVPKLGGYLQQLKSGGRESEPLVLQDIADFISEDMDDETLWLVAPGGTTQGILSAMELNGSLLGFDAVQGRQVLALDLSASDISARLAAHNGPVKVLLTIIGGQGHLLGRGNQQLTPDIIRQIGRENFMVVATKSKITELSGRPFLVDSNSASLDREWEGYIPVITGYRDSVLYRVSANSE
ncbi:MAG: ATP-NAD kinase family protein [Spongiibacteraceae bacterium]